jgi:hypothetical protein
MPDQEKRERRDSEGRPARATTRAVGTVNNMTGHVDYDVIHDKLHSEVRQMHGEGSSVSYSGRRGGVGGLFQFARGAPACLI